MWYYKEIQIWLREKAERTNTQLPASPWTKDHGFAFSLFILQIGKLKLKLTVCATVGSIGSMYCSANFIVLWNSPVYFRSALMIHWGMRDAVLLSVTIWLAGMCFLWKCFENCSQKCPCLTCQFALKWKDLHWGRSDVLGMSELEIPGCISRKNLTHHCHMWPWGPTV